MGIPKEVVIVVTAHENTKMIDAVCLHVSSHDKAYKSGEAIIEKARGSTFATYKEQAATKPEVDVFNYVFAGDPLLGLTKKYEATKVREVLDKDLDKGFLELPTTKQAIAILKDTNRTNKVNINKYKGDEELKYKVKVICTIVWEIGRAANDVLLIQFFQGNMVTLGLNIEYYLSKTTSKREIQRLLEMKPYKGAITA